MKARARLAVLASGAGSNLQAVLDACASGALPAEVVVVACNRAKALALVRAEHAGVATLHAPLGGFADRAAYDADLALRLAAFDPDLVVLAGWMLVLGKGFLDCFAGRVINLHPALPGALPGTEAIARAWQAGRAGTARETGVMVHHVVPEVDAGPVVLQERVPLLPGETLPELEARMHAVEHRLLVAAIAKMLADLGQSRASHAMAGSE